MRAWPAGKMVANRVLTENGAATERGTGSDCLDLFATIGALRSQRAAEVGRRILRAYAEDSDVAMRILFYARA